MLAGRTSRFLVLGVALLFSACAVVPESGRTQLMLISPGQELSMGRQAFAEVRSGATLSTDKNATAMVQRVGKNIASVADLPRAEWEFVLFQNSEPNAFCLPGGKVGIYTGMLPIAKTEAGLATVIAHEVAHAVARHGAEQMSEQLGGQLFAITLINSLSEMDEGTRALVFAAYGLGMTFGRTLPHSRLQETEADAIGLMYMARAGYDPEEAIKFWERFSEYKIEKGGGQKPLFLSTHPLDRQRMEDLKRIMPRAKLQYRPR